MTFANKANVDIAIQMFKSLYEYMFSFFLHRVEGLDNMLAVFLSCRNAAKLLSKAVAQFYIPIRSVCKFQFLFIIANTWYGQFL